MSDWSRVSQVTLFSDRRWSLNQDQDLDQILDSIKRIPVNIAPIRCRWFRFHKWSKWEYVDSERYTHIRDEVKVRRCIGCGLIESRDPKFGWATDIPQRYIKR